MLVRVAFWMTLLALVVGVCWPVKPGEDSFDALLEGLAAGLVVGAALGGGVEYALSKRNAHRASSNNTRYGSDA